MTFNELGLNDELLKAITDLGFETPSDVQKESIPILLEKKTDIVSLAQTGTGKTAAFGLPLLQLIDINQRHTQGLIIAPTRELCVQITRELEKYAKYLSKFHVVSIYGGASIDTQIRSIKKGAQVVVATPGRLKDMIRRRAVDLSRVQYTILDEADEMLNMGFVDDINDILSETPDTKNVWLFSATMPKEVQRIANTYMTDPVKITVGTVNAGTKNVSHECYVVNQLNRYKALKRLADANPDIFSVIFCRTKRETQEVAEKLIEDGYNAASIHGDLSQNQRDLVMKSFRSNQIQMLVATDVAARGIDVNNISHVINYRLPDEAEIYTHRTGRTGRAGKTGTAISIVTRKESSRLKYFEKILKNKIEIKDIPSGEEICKVQLIHLANKIKDSTADESINDHLPALNEILDGIERDNLIKKIFSLEFTKMLDYYKNSRDLNSKPENAHSFDGNSTRFFISLGERDDFNWQSLKDFIQEKTGLTRDEVFKVDTKTNFSFFNVDNDKKQLVLDTFADMQHEGRRVGLEISTNPSGNEMRNKRNRRRGNSDRSDRRGGSGISGGFRSSGRSNDRRDRSDRNDRGYRSSGRSNSSSSFSNSDRSSSSDGRSRRPRKKY